MGMELNESLRQLPGSSSLTSRPRIKKREGEGKEVPLLKNGAGVIDTPLNPCTKQPGLE